MGLFDTSGSPVIIKEDTSATDQLFAMREMLPDVAESDRKRLERDIALLEAGLAGEEKILYELRNSHMDICVIRDLKLRWGDLTAQIDFLIMAPHVNVVIECKQLVGNIEVNARGEFIRTFGAGRRARREGMYSPVTQNARHVDLIMSILHDLHPLASTVFSAIDRITGTSPAWESLVVLANPKSLLTMDEAPKDIQNKIVRADGLVERLKELDRKSGRSGNPRYSLKENISAANRWIERGVDEPIDLSGRYEMNGRARAENTETYQDTRVDINVSEAVVETPICPRCGAPMVLRTAKKGKRAGLQFWGCSTYPKCRGIINITN